jgi:hypothetical protein
MTLSYPGLEGSQVIPVTLEAPVHEAGWWGWFWEYGVFVLGATMLMVLMGTAWFLIRIRARGRKGEDAC